jgi:hypothetical protein
MEDEMGLHQENSKALEPGRDRRWQYGIRILTGAMMVLFMVFVGIIIYFITKPTPFDPLRFQTVLIREVEPDGTIIIPQVPGEDAPSIYVNQTLPAVFQFCSDAEEDFVATGNSWFVDATHGTRYVLNEDIESTIRYGCVAPRLHIEVPAQVRVDLLDFASGVGPSGAASPWYVEGELTPNRDGGVTATWKSEIFYIIAEQEP